MNRILIVEDQADIRRLIEMTLELENFELHAVATADQGLASMHLRPDLVLLDVMTPGTLNGLDLCRQLKASPETAHIKVVLLTARGQASDIQAGEAAGCDAYLVKPFSPLHLLQTLERVLA